MNGRQAARAAAAKIVELEYICGRNKRDIFFYNQCIDSMIQGKSPCEWCEDLEKCEKDEKGHSGCYEWMLAFKYGDEPAPEGGDSDGDASEGLLQNGQEGGVGAEDASGAGAAL